MRNWECEYKCVFVKYKANLGSIRDITGIGIEHVQISEVEIYKREQESEKTRKHAFDKESGQEK